MMTEQEYQEHIEKICGRDFLGLYGEVVTCDTYRIRSLDFVPDTVIDIGANVGFFSRFAHQLFPLASIVSVEPDEDNCAKFRSFPAITEAWESRSVLLELALGSGVIYQGLTARNGSGATYLSSGLGYPRVMMDRETKMGSRKKMVVANVGAMTLSQILSLFCRPGRRVVLKIDCEGAENTIWNDVASMTALKSVDYLAMELHDYAISHAERHAVLERTRKALEELQSTHNCSREGVHFWARRMTP